MISQMKSKSKLGVITSPIAPIKLNPPFESELVDEDFHRMAFTV
jgi:hypothetical protein